MTYKKLILLLCLCAWLPTCAQTVRLSGVCSDSAFHDMRLSLRLLDENKEKCFAAPLTVKGQGFSGQVAASSTGLYYLCGATKQSQIMLPVYLPDTTRTYKLELSIVDGCPIVKSDNDNDALSAYNKVYYAQEKTFWSEAKGWTVDKFLPFLKGYMAKADSIADRYKCTATVANFLQVWACSAAYGDYTSIPHMLGSKQVELPFGASDIFGNIQNRIDRPMAEFFPILIQAVVNSVPKGNLQERVDYLHANYKSAGLVQTAQTALVEDYIRSYNFGRNYEEGLAELKTVVEKYGVDKRFVKDFEARKASVRGADFPNVRLTDIDGNTVRFNSFRGSYVYVDMWASWCGPCCKEAPYLQALEKELAGNNNVKFVSVSIDRDAAAWKRKMNDLGLHDNQLLNQDNTLAEALNVKGIPFFLIYDKEGRLYMYDAPRPSDPTLKALLNDLH